MEIETKILDQDQCEKRYQILNPPSYNSSVNICAGGEGKSICFGDSGGPLVAKVGEKWQLAGISSWVLYTFVKSCYEGGSFTKTSAYINWIKENIQGNFQKIIEIWFGEIWYKIKNRTEINAKND